GMSVAVTAVRVVLAAVFAVAGWTKLSDSAGTRAAAQAFGVPSTATPAVAFLVPVAELAVSILLLFGGSAADPGAVGAIALLGLFIVAIAVSLARGRRPDCHCFGGVRSETVSARTLVRNAVLLGAALLVLARA
ncbi:MAG: DoxX family membrane protein, partial [Acidimicrobiia bacterium]|nr:DoxX family membrane protein [Acidimicrobiia bacterium]